VPEDALALARGRQEARPGWGKAFRERKRKGKAQRKSKGKA
jgi:hypothetical protein